ncbi:MAG: hypothetical protein KBA53_10280 [Thermoclostridium sp.]|nr:hypothetical protein [Thermoclostridium sp.]
MKSYVKILSLTLVMCLILVLFPGCKQKTGNGDTVSKDTTPTVTPAAQTPVPPSDTGTSNGVDISVSLPIIPPLVFEDKTGPVIDLVNAMAAEYKEGKITFDVFPMARSIENVFSGKADCHYPFIKNHDIQDSDDKFYYTTDYGKVIFVLYTNRNVKDLTPQNIHDEKFKIEIQQGHKEYLGDFPESDIPAGLQKANSNRIDGFICTMDTGDPIMKQMQLADLKRHEFDTFNVSMVFLKNDAGKQKSEIMTSLLKKLKDNGTYDKIMGAINSAEVFVPDAE